MYQPEHYTRLTCIASASSPQLKASLPQAPPQTSSSEHSNSTLNADDDFRNPVFCPDGLGAPDQNDFMPQTSSLSDGSPPANLPNPSPMDSFNANSNLMYAQQFQDPYDQQLSNIIFAPMMQDASDSGLQEARFSSTSPQMMDMLLPQADLSERPHSRDPQPEQASIQLENAGPSADLLGEDMTFEEGFDEEIPRDLSTHYSAASHTLSNNWSRRHVSPASSDSSSSSATSGFIIYGQPRLKATSDEMLSCRFAQQTCGILSIKDGAAENPWRTLIMPLARDSPPLRHAIFSMSALHGSRESKELQFDGVDHMQKSCAELVATMNNMHVDAALATTLALAFSDSWDEQVQTGIQHLRGSRHYVSKAISRQKALTRRGMPDPDPFGAERLKFLCNTYIYMDVLARLTSLEETEHEADDDYFENIMLAVNGPLHNVNQVDPLLGCAYTLFPLIGRVANLVQKVRKTETNSITLVSQATELKQLLQQWVVPNAMIFERPEDPTSEVEHSIQTAEAYRWATLLYLYQAVPEICSEMPLQLAKQTLLYLARVPQTSRAIIVQIFPLLAASCEVVDQDDRTFVIKRWQAMINRLQIRNVHKCLEVVEEVWTRRDDFEREKAERAWRKQTVRNGTSTSGLLSPTNEPGKRKATTLEPADSDNFMRDYSGTESGHAGSGVSHSKRRVTMDLMGRPVPLATMSMEMRPPPPPTFTRRPSDMPSETIGQEYTVRGRLHWLGVMKDHGWEGELDHLIVLVDRRRCYGQLLTRLLCAVLLG